MVLVALSEETQSQVGRYVKQNKLPYIVGSGAKTAAKAYGIKAFPSAFLIGPDGVIEWVGHPNTPEAEKNIERVLKENPPKSKDSLGKRVAKADFEKAEKLYEKKKYAEALKAYEQVVENFKESKYAKLAKAKVEEIRADKKIMAKIRATQQKRDCENWLQMARSLAKKGKGSDAVEYYDRVIKEYPDSEYARTAEEEKDKLTG